MKKLFQDFKEFIMRGNVIDLAIGVIIGSAFGVLITSVVNNLLMPPLGLLLGGADFKDLFIILKQGESALTENATLEMAQEVGAVTLNYGQFLTDLINFLLLALGVFLIVKAIMAFQKSRKEKPAEPTEKGCPFCQKAIPINATRCPFCTSELE